MEEKNYYSVAALIRAVLDHIPPIFDQPNFDSVVSQSKKTFKEIVSRLNELRDPANIHLHSQCSSSVSLAVEHDVDKRSDISMLLSKTIEQLKKIYNFLIRKDQKINNTLKCQQFLFDLYSLQFNNNKA
ncbi:MAG: hypothetical protein IPG39_12620 [Bacteroidetes bacterium]|nr:hypothetical protein [Bacteroidota bacterium]